MMCTEYLNRELACTETQIEEQTKEAIRASNSLSRLSDVLSSYMEHQRDRRSVGGGHVLVEPSSPEYDKMMFNSSLSLHGSIGSLESGPAYLPFPVEELSKKERRSMPSHIQPLVAKIDSLMLAHDANNDERRRQILTQHEEIDALRSKVRELRPPSILKSGEPRTPTSGKNRHTYNCRLQL